MPNATCSVCSELHCVFWLVHSCPPWAARYVTSHEIDAKRRSLVLSFLSQLPSPVTTMIKTPTISCSCEHCRDRSALCFMLYALLQWGPLCFEHVWFSMLGSWYDVPIRRLEHCCFRVDFGNEAFLCDTIDACDLHAASVAICLQLQCFVMWRGCCVLASMPSGMGQLDSKHCATFA